MSINFQANMTDFGTAINKIPLEDIITPTAINFWPPAIGWWVLLCLIIFITYFTNRHLKRYKKKWSYRKQALLLLEEKLNDLENKKISKQTACEHFLTILKRTAISAYPYHNINSLYGDQWLTLLQTQAPALLIDESLRDAISSSQYKRINSTNPEQLFKYCESWVNQHNEFYFEQDENKVATNKESSDVSI